MSCRYVSTSAVPICGCSSCCHRCKQCMVQALVKFWVVECIRRWCSCNKLIDLGMSRCGEHSLTVSIA